MVRSWFWIEFATVLNLFWLLYFLNPFIEPVSGLLGTLFIIDASEF